MNQVANMIFTENVYNLIKIDNTSIIPKYLQIVKSIGNGIENNCLPTGYRLPSINELSYELDISKDTTVRVYKVLKEMGVIDSTPGKGYYTSLNNHLKEIKIILLFDELSINNKTIYDSLVRNLGKDAIIDLFIYNNNLSDMCDILKVHREGYSHYLILPPSFDDPRFTELLKTIPQNKLILLGRLSENINMVYSAVYEDFVSNIFNVLLRALDKLKKYNTIKAILPKHNHFNTAIIKGISAFCKEQQFNFETIYNLNEEKITKGIAYITLDEEDFVFLIEKILYSKLIAGKHVGLISYNETPLKKVILEGITTISADFYLMGEKAAELIVQKSKKKISIPFKLILRDSL